MGVQVAEGYRKEYQFHDYRKEYADKYAHSGSDSGSAAGSGSGAGSDSSDSEEMTTTEAAESSTEMESTEVWEFASTGTVSLDFDLEIDNLFSVRFETLKYTVTLLGANML